MGICRCGHSYFSHNYDEYWDGEEEYSVTRECEECACEEFFREEE